MEQDLSVILVPDGEVGTDLIEMAEAWLRAGLLRASAWLSPSHVERLESGPPRVRCVHLVGREARDSDLFTVVGTQRLDRLRLIVVHPSGLPREAHSSLSDTGIELSRLLTAVLPLGTGPDDRGTLVHRIKLVVPTSEATDLPSDVLQADWDMNAVVSPEDRPDVDRGSVFVRQGLNHLGHICNAVCAVGGLWSGMPAGALDSVTSDSTTSDGWLHVIRATARAVSGGNRLEQLAEQTIDTIDDLDTSDFVRWGRRAADPEGLAERGVAYLLETEHWAVPTSRQSLERRRDQRAAGGVIGHAIQYNLRLFGTGWRWLVRSGEEAISRALTDKLVGQESDVHVVLRPVTPTDLTSLGQREERAARRTIGEAVGREGATLDVPAPETWRDLRQMTLSLVDGAELSEEVRPQSGSLVDVLPKQWAAPLPDDTLVVKGRNVGIVDVIAFRSIPREPLEVTTAIASDHEEKERAESETVSGDDDTSVATDGGTRGSGSGSLAEDAEDRTQAWYARRRGSFLWALASALADQLAEAEKRRAQLDSTAQVSTEAAHNAVTAAYTQLVRSWRLGLLGLMIGVGALVWWFVDKEASPRQLALAALLGLLVWAAFIALANHRYFKADLKYRRQIATAVAQRRANADELVSLRRTISWLRARYDGLMLWAPILAELIHRPWGSVPHTTSALSAEEVDQLPAALGIAVSAGAQREEFTSGVITDAVNVLCPKGYMHRIWDDVFHDFLEHSGRASHSSVELVDGDELQTQASPRRELLEFIESGVARRQAATRAVARVADAVDEHTVRLPSLLVKRLGPYSDGQTVPEEGFYAASLRSATPFTIDFWTPEGQVASKHLVNRSLVWLPAALDVSPPPSIELAQCHGRVAVRVDLSRRCSAEDIVAFLPSSVSRDEPSWSEADIDRFN